MADQLTFDQVQDLCEQLTAAGVPAVTDPSDISLPGAWVTVEEIRVLNLAGNLRLSCAVYLVTGDRDHRRALEGLAALYNLACTVFRPDGPTRTQGLLLPEAPTQPMPALRLPVNLSSVPSMVTDFVMENV